MLDCGLDRVVIVRGTSDPPYFNGECDMKKFINLTPHTININDGAAYAASGVVARVANNHTPFDADGVASIEWGEVTGLPAPQDGVIYIVSGLVAQAAKRQDVVSPASGHPNVIRNNGQIVSVPGFIRS
jgi:hypothetical protein